MIKSIFHYTLVCLGLCMVGTSFVYASTVTSSTTATTAGATTASSSTAATTTTVATTTLAVSRVESEKAVRAYFADIPAMIEIARCESNFRQFTDAGNVFRDASGDMVGIFQFYEISHKASALARGLDLETLDGNMKYARSLYEAQGVRPWQSCAPVTPVQTSLDAETKLKIELMTKVIELLQQLLALQLAR